MMLDKLLSRFAQECSRVDADHWRLALTNGHALNVSARRDQGFLLFDADTGVSPAAEHLVPLAERALPASVKFARRGSAAVRLRAEFPLLDASDALADRIEMNLDGMRSALYQLHNSASSEAAGETAACLKPKGDGQAAPGGLAELLKEAGWECRERLAGALLADLETGSRFLQAEIDGCGGGARFRVTLYRNDDSGEAARQALCLYLLEANAALRYTRAFLQTEGEGMAAGFEVCVASAPTAAETGHALAALSVAGRECSREMEALQDGVVAGIYRSARIRQNKGD